jgi:ribosome-binding factor A
VVTAQRGLDSAKGFIKKQIGLRMMLRYVPEITFLHDMSLQKGSRLEKLLDELTVSDSGDGTE